MSRIKKILFGLLAFIVLTAFTLAIWLYTDKPFSKTDTSGLIRTISTAIELIDSNPKPEDTLKNIIVDGQWFKDQTGRTLLLRGVNLGGSTKVPALMPTHKKEGFFETAETVSFVGKPFPLEEADEHFSRLKAWGFHFLRFLVTWEAIEHAGPRVYDEAYIDYVYRIIKKAGEYDLNVFVDPHQDVWSRFSGGDGAPKWTFDVAGLDVSQFQTTGAAIVHNTRGDPFPKMIWPTNYAKLGTATMFTLFFGGNDFAPQTMVNDTIPIQDFLQSHYIKAIAHLAERLKDLPNVIGYDTMNEPHAGFIGHKDLEAVGIFTIGETHTPLQAMALGSGVPQEVDFYKIGISGPKVTERVWRNLDEESAWLKSRPAIWRQHGVWDVNAEGQPVILKKDYFTTVNGDPVDFSEDYFKPFIRKFARAITKVDPEAIIFVEPALNSDLPDLKDLSNIHFAAAPHRYDVFTLITKSYSPVLAFDVSHKKPVFGKKNVRLFFNGMMAAEKQHTKNALGDAPTLIGEFGIPFDMHNKKAYSTGDYSKQIAAIDRLLNALEANLLSYTLWNYTADNTNERGDLWNGEDLSIFSRDQQTDPSDINSGGRALEAVVRPYPYKVAGTLTYYQFNYKKKEIVLRFDSDPSIAGPTEVFLPEFHFGEGFEVWHSKGVVEWDKQRRLLLFNSDDTKGILVVRKNTENN